MQVIRFPDYIMGMLGLDNLNFGLNPLIIMHLLFLSKRKKARLAFLVLLAALLLHGTSRQEYHIKRAIYTGLPFDGLNYLVMPPH